ncbi:uncharacterized protein BXZ73DRAFT_44500 [Epithele typhae]|uniref:uncharacterized protein n=1 Tax=Epithele typhae TaxID=378194 RepID=UPI002007C37C|nr:uncharacterized protein BXZ73DRAFT_44500 [Epithele typhae]KAH9938751.1 hypothetical protein BXZ73DRAFT_44500 [Epithele typhae]
MVRLITRNLLACHAKGCTSNKFPLCFKDVAVDLRDAEFLPDFLPGPEWPVLVDAAREVRCVCCDCEGTLADRQLEMVDEDCLKKAHHLLLEVDPEGTTVFANCSHVYPLSNGISNMLLAEHEIG